MSVDVISAFLAGLLTFIAPCTLPLIPAYIAFIGGTGGKEKHVRKNAEGERVRVFTHALYFVLGFSVIFMLFGLISGAIGSYLLDYRHIMARIGGVIIVLFGLSLLDVFPMGRFFVHAARPLPPAVRAGTSGGSFLLGFLFGLGWTPCLGPILGTILILAVTDGEMLRGAFLLGVYSLGIGIPFLALAILYQSAFTYVRSFSRFIPPLAAAGAWVLIAFGLLLVFGQATHMGEFVSGLFGNINYESIIPYM